MKLDALRAIVESTSRRLDEGRIDELKHTVHDARQRLRNGFEGNVRSAAVLRGVDPDPEPRAVERMMGADDLVSVNYLARAQRASRAVCRIVLLSPSGNELGYGTGFLVSPRVIMTNHHVLPRESQAAAAVVEFGYEHDVNGRLMPTTRFPLQPSAFFLANQKLDFALCAVAADPRSGSARLADHGFLRVLGGDGRVAPGDFVTIIQHPSGRPKQIALRENELLGFEGDFMHYQSDTAPGSSGSPVFNDSWQIVGLHHSGVPRTDGRGNWLLRNGDVAGPEDDDGDIDWIANEGVRSSRIVDFVNRRNDPREHAEEFLRVAEGSLAPSAGPVQESPPPAHVLPVSVPGSPGARIEPIPGGARVTVPLSFTVSVDGGGHVTAAPETPGRPSPEPDHPAVDDLDSLFAPEGYKQPVIDEDYSNRRGYSPGFLGVDLPMPRPRWTSKVAKMDDGEHVIPYEHFSIVMDKARRMALITAANVDGRKKSRRPEEGKTYTRKALNGFTSDASERWALDPRLAAGDQLPDIFYTKDRQAFDKGHLVRRDVVCFGRTYAQVQRANGDSFHTTNCSPQVKGFNRSPGSWGSLENAIMDNAEKRRLCVFSGPLFRRNDRWFDGVDKNGELRVKIPRTYWKVVVSREEGELRAYAFLLSQDLGNVQFRAELDFDGEWAESMVSIEDLDRWTPAVRFPSALKHADQFGTDLGAELLAVTPLVGFERLALRGEDAEAE